MHQKIFVVLTAFAIFSCANQGTGDQVKPAAPQGLAALGTVKESAVPDQLLWGDTHLHTSWSADAGASGTRVGPEDAVRFAMGEEIRSNTGQMARILRPLDWFCVTDHSDAMGVISGIIEGNPELLKDPIIKQWNADINSGDPKRASLVMMDIVQRQANRTLPAAVTDSSFARDVWHKNNEIMEKYYKPGKFTTFIAYEWTSNYKGGMNLHRNVIYRGNAQEANAILPFTTFQSEDPEDLWKWMDAYEKKTGGKLLAIPHNGNMSNGYMFALTTLSGKPFSKEYAEARQKWEVLYEVTQTKGTGETHPSLSPTDEFANFEIWDKGNLTLIPKNKGDLNTEYAREGLKDGLVLEQQLGVNPFKFGMAGGTDYHTGISSIDESNFFGKFKSSEPSKERASEDAIKFNGRSMKGWELGASGWTGVWATANTREAIWDAMKRKETYATTGPRISVRVFGGYDFTREDLDAADMVQRGYKKGVPMGGDLGQPAAGKKATLIISAVKDPEGANLDRVQVVKGWVDKNGKKQEKIFEVVWGDADKRKPDAKGKLPAVGNSVNPETLVVGDNIGDPELKVVWTDPEFDPSVPCFYYLRVLEIPTPRWTAYDKKKFNLQMDPKVPLTTQERCYTSPIWYTPKRS